VNDDEKAQFKALLRPHRAAFVRLAEASTPAGAPAGARVWTDREGRRQLSLVGVDFAALVDHPPHEPRAHEPAEAEAIRLRAEVRELRRQLHEARQTEQGLRDMLVPDDDE
jgi:hypothetical protein